MANDQNQMIEEEKLHVQEEPVLVRKQPGERKDSIGSNISSDKEKEEEVKLSSTSLAEVFGSGRFPPESI